MVTSSLRILLVLLLTCEFDELQGRFTGILPPREPKDNDAQMARVVLAGMGYIVEGKGTSPIWN